VSKKSGPGARAKRVEIMRTPLIQRAVKDLQRVMPVCHICFDFLAEFQVTGGAH